MLGVEQGALCRQHRGGWFAGLEFLGQAQQRQVKLGDAEPRDLMPARERTRRIGFGEGAAEPRRDRVGMALDDEDAAHVDV